jgi:hypothetical protein
MRQAFLYGNASLAEGQFPDATPAFEQVRTLGPTRLNAALLRGSGTASRTHRHPNDPL